ncbi:hypothetical protein C488_00277 [Natrinema pellirubrum DSM 15624]|uniref:ABC-type nitrate/sulfonate/bicarbonate transport system, periplasmic component n=1 Tax=Natrinema pellirubrum (strain DSM 15624 / CIP 106293 / JCM 10476 / NCIMB 786 / 157) TaxID=797303 RepID=L0JKS0_NATP1|nr:ABC transporter substrate-binding protein [Natrinema pellirubrum]AGB31433.1 ABC-type nitrate/sulfonate/bicarbonate transport system, periplasmic component [Natrinema pellirubrum DSM 15624]ELY82014.1 hypothetical protein C488_00277 [Natrinema pellirubrum DSM 15624]
MDVRTFPVLTDEDEPVVDRLSLGTGERQARVLAYLLCRRADPDLSDAASRTATHIGAGLSKHATTDALTELAAAGLIAETTATTGSPGRPPKAWHAVAPKAETVRRVDARHADRLLEQGERYAGLEPAGAESADDERNGGDTDGPASESAERSDAERVTVALNWRPNGLHLPLLAARDTDGGVSLAFESADGSRAAALAVASGECAVGVAGAATVLRARSLGHPVVPIAVCFQRSPVVLYTTRSAFGEPLEAVGQLRGRRVGMPNGTETGLLGRLLLEQAGIRDAVELVAVDGEEGAALQSGAVDAVTGMAPDPVRLEAAGRTVDSLAVSAAYPAYGPALIAAEGRLRRDRDRFAAFLETVLAGWADAVCEPESVARTAASETDESAHRLARTFQRATDRFADSEGVRRNGWGWHSPDAWRNLRDALAQGGLLEGE